MTDAAPSTLRIALKLPTAELQIDGDPAAVRSVYDAFMASMDRMGGVPGYGAAASMDGGEMSDRERLGEALGIVEPRPVNADLSAWTRGFADDPAS